MKTTVTCPGCHAHLAIAQAALSGSVQCPRCQAVIATGPQPPPAAPAPASAWLLRGAVLAATVLGGIALVVCSIGLILTREDPPIPRRADTPANDPTAPIAPVAAAKAPAKIDPAEKTPAGKPAQGLAPTAAPSEGAQGLGTTAPAPVVADPPAPAPKSVPEKSNAPDPGPIESSLGVDLSKPKAKEPQSGADADDGPEFAGPIQRNQEINIEIPFRAIGSMERLREIQGVGIVGDLRFVKTGQLNRVALYSEGLDLYKYEESHHNKRTKTVQLLSRVLLVDTAAWYKGEEKTVPLVGDGLAFYQNFNFPLIASNLIPFAKTKFDIQKEAAEEEVRDEPCFVLKVSHKDKLGMRMYFAKSDQLLRKVSFRGKFLKTNQEFAVKETDVDLYFGNYVDEDGVKHWRKCEQWRDDVEYTVLTIKTVQFTKISDETKFLVPELEAEIKQIFQERANLQKELLKLEGLLARGEFAEAEKCAQTLAEKSPKIVAEFFPIVSRLVQAPRHKIQRYLKAQRHKEARTLAATLDEFYGKIEPILDVAKSDEMKADVEKLRREDQKVAVLVQGHIVHGQAKQKIYKAQTIAKASRPSTKQLREALAFYAEARKLLKSATPVPPDVVKADVERVRLGTKKLMATLCPIQLDAGDPDTDEPWRRSNVTVGRDAKYPCYRAKTAQGGTLSADIAEFPANFDLAIEFVLFDQSGTIRNKLWRSYPRMLQVTLEPVNKAEPAVLVHIGRSPKYNFDAGGVGAIVVNKASFSTAALEAEAGTCAIRISQADDNLTVKVGDKTLTSLPAGRFKRLSIRLSNGSTQSGSTVAEPGVLRVNLWRQD